MVREMSTPLIRLDFCVKFRGMRNVSQKWIGIPNGSIGICVYSTSVFSSTVVYPFSFYKIYTL